MQHDYAATLAAPRDPAREAAASARGRLGRFYDRTMARFARYRARHELLALGEHTRRDIGLTRAADTPRSIASRKYARMCSGAWVWPFQG